MRNGLTVTMVALALADLMERSGTGSDFAAVDRLLSVLAGSREDVSLAQLSELRKEAGIKAIAENAPTALHGAIGDGCRSLTDRYCLGIS